VEALPINIVAEWCGFVVIHPGNLLPLFRIKLRAIVKFDEKSWDVRLVPIEPHRD
jgi:hypothetical protein